MILTRSILKRYNAFELERLRSQLAVINTYSALRKTYSPLYAAIKDENTPALWDILNTIYEDKSFQKDPMAQARVRFVTRKLPAENCHILNVGFGSGSLEESYFTYNNKRSFFWHGIDISRDSVKSARKRFPAGDFSVGNILSIREKACSFDAVIALEVLEHIPPKYTFQALQELWRVTKPSGSVILSVPLNEGLEALIKSGINPNAHVRIYSADLLKAELTMAGFVVTGEEVFYAFNTFYHFKTTIAKYILPGIRQPNNIVVIAKKIRHKK